MDARERLDQSAIPQCFVYYPLQPGCRENYILYADDQVNFLRLFLLTTTYNLLLY